jgi:hypothetical protein
MRSSLGYSKLRRLTEHYTNKEILVKSLIFLILGSLMSVSSHSSDANHLSFGLGTDQGGLGFQYSLNNDNSKYYIALGLHSYSQASGTNLGYGLGGEKLIGKSRNSSLGLFLGAISSSAVNTERTTYHGVAATYNYYFNAFANNSWVVGGSLDYGRSSNNASYFSDSTSQASLKLSYQW